MKLSVIIPAFNASRSISRAVASANAAGADEIIVIDDGSSDSTAEAAEVAGARVIKQPNAGAATARRRGIAMATGELIILLDADDALCADGVAAATELLASQSEFGLVHGGTIGLSTDGGRQRLSTWPEGVSLESLLRRGHAPGPPSSFIWRRTVLNEVVSRDWEGLWPRYAEDYEFIVRGASVTRVGTSPTTMNEYAWQGGKSSNAPLASIQSAEDIRRHYAATLKIRIHQRSPRQLRAMALLRQASELGSGTARYRMAYIKLRAFSTSPSLLFEKVYHRLTDTTDLSGSLANGASSDALFAGQSLRQVMAHDRNANPREFLSIILLAALRVTQWSMGSLANPRRSSLPLIVVYRLVTELLFGIEIRPKTQVGPGLTLYHRIGTVVNDHTVIGSGVVLRHGTTIGLARPGGGAPVIEDGVELGANVTILGDIRIGRGAVVAAGSVVVKSVAPFTTVAGNPARQIGELR